MFLPFPPMRLSHRFRTRQESKLEVRYIRVSNQACCHTSPALPAHGCPLFWAYNANLAIHALFFCHHFPNIAVAAKFPPQQIPRCSIRLYERYVFICGREAGVAADILPGCAIEPAVDCHVEAIQHAIFKWQRGDPPWPMYNADNFQ
jgi:hypothetical protein